jgi:hypothetical protein
MENRMNIDTIYSTWQSRAGGSSGFGNSFYSDAAECGRRAVLRQQEREQGPKAFVPATETDPFGVGSAYHFFHELAITGDVPDMVLDMTDAAMDANFLEGLRLFRGWVELWGSMAQKYGRVLGAEVPVQAANDTFDGPFTGRLDALVEIENPGLVAAKTGLHLEAGVYVVDYKTAKSAGNGDALKFTIGTQARGYLAMHPQAKGVIFDVLYKVQVFRHEPKLASTGKVVAGKSYAHYVQTPSFEDKDIIGALVRIGKYNYDNNLANPSACLRSFSPCPYLLNGKCEGY